MADITPYFTERVFKVAQVTQSHVYFFFIWLNENRRLLRLLRRRRIPSASQMIHLHASDWQQLKQMHAVVRLREDETTDFRCVDASKLSNESNGVQFEDKARFHIAQLGERIAAYKLKETESTPLMDQVDAFFRNLCRWFNDDIESFKHSENAFRLHKLMLSILCFGLPQSTNTQGLMFYDNRPKHIWTQHLDTTARWVPHDPHGSQ